LELTKRSACSWANEISTPLLIIHGDHDSSVNVNQAREMAAALQTSNKNYKLEIVPGQSHNFFFFDSFREQIVGEIIQWFKQF
jgi:dipeptidyl aminopeptidase/acylaminoacyl peptidase